MSLDDTSSRTVKTGGFVMEMSTIDRMEVKDGKLVIVFECAELEFISPSGIDARSVGRTTVTLDGDAAWLLMKAISKYRSMGSI